MTELFDDYTDTYREEVERSISFARGDLDHFTAVKARHLISLTARHLGDPGDLTVLDVGCGTGETDQHLVGHVGRLLGVDVAKGPLNVAAQRNPDADYTAYDGATLPYAPGSVDVSFAICVMHHVPPPQWPPFLAQLRRVTRPGGLVVIFEHNPLNPLTRRAVNSCEFDANAVLLRRRRVAGLMRAQDLDVVEQAYIVFVPFGGERMATAERLLARVPLGAQHYVAGRVR